MNLEQAVEAYNAATDKLDGIRDDLRVNAHELQVARINLKRSQRALEQRLVSLYTSADRPSTLGILLGAGSMEDMLNQIDSADRVAGQDIRINREVIHFKAVVKHHRAELKNAEAEQQQLVQERADAKASIESQLSDRRSLVQSIRSEIVQMKAEERRRQAELARQAAAARAAERQQAQEAALGNPYATRRGRRRFTVAPSSVGPQSSRSPSGTSGSRTSMRERPERRLRLLGARHVRVRAGRHLTPALRRVAVRLRDAVSQDQLEPGDLVFFNSLGHVGI